MKYYKTRYYGNVITEVGVERVTDSSIWINGRRNALSTQYENYHASWEDAKQYLIGRAQDQVNNKQRELKYAEEELAEAKALTQ